jgi:hypothetical protein
LLTAVVRWEYRYGGPAHCLGRLYSSSSSQLIAVLSEVRTNPDTRSMSSADQSRIAEAFLAVMPVEVPLEPRAVVWVAHHGEFSSYDAFGAPDSFTWLKLGWDGHQYHYEGSRLLDSDEAEVLLAGLDVGDPLGALAQVRDAP